MVLAFRELEPLPSIETNTRQNGYNISADIFGYNEAYYLPPMEAVFKSITFYVETLPQVALA
jgi:hypothetical protein